MTSKLVRGAITVLALGALCCSVLARGEARAQDNTAEARRNFDQGVQRFQAGSFTEALASFREAYRLRPHPSVLVNIANCYLNLDKPLEAAGNFEQYLREAGEGVDPRRRQEVERALGRARAALATITAHGPEGTAVVVDGDEVARIPMRRPVEMNPGNHHVELRLPNGRTDVQEISLHSGEARTLEVDAVMLTPIEPTRPTNDTAHEARTSGSANAGRPPTHVVPTVAEHGDGDQESERPSSETPSHGGGVPVATWITGGVAVAALVTGVIFGVTALDQKSEFDDIAADIHSRAPNDPQIPALQHDGRSIADARQTNALVSDLMFATAAVSAGLAVYFLVSADDTEEPPATTVGATVVPGGAMLGARGSF